MWEYHDVAQRKDGVGLGELLGHTESSIWQKDLGSTLWQLCGLLRFWLYIWGAHHPLSTTTSYLLQQSAFQQDEGQGDN
jgi:hypothetical protein